MWEYNQENAAQLCAMADMRTALLVSGNTEENDLFILTLKELGYEELEGRLQDGGETNDTGGSETYRPDK